MSKLNSETTNEELAKIALKIVGFIDYDIQKELAYAVEDYEKGEGEYPWELSELETYLAGLVS